jgi:hypothetical protein
VSTRKLAVGLASLALGVLATLPAAATGSSPTHPTALISLASANQSNNWSGYNLPSQNASGQTVTTYHAVSGDWIVPAVSQRRPGEAESSSTWVGIGGGCASPDCSSTDSTIIQAGVEQDVDQFGTPSYTAWWADALGSETPVSMKVNPGDHMHVSVTETPTGSNHWVFTIQDLTSGQTVTQTTTYSSTYGSAEWILEASLPIPSQGTSVFGPLPNMAPVQFDNAVVNGKAAVFSTADEMQMTSTVDLGPLPVVTDEPVLGDNATPSSPDPDGDGFFSCAHAASCTAPTGDLA